MNQSRYDYCLKHVLKSEGGYSNHPADRGKVTMFGVIATTYDRYRLNKGLPLRNVKNIEWSEVSEIYKTYWDSSRCDEIQEPLDLLVFDFSINSGSSRAIKTLQTCLGVIDDGIIGRNTLTTLNAAINMLGVTDLCARYLEARRDFLFNLTVRDPSQTVFMKGWNNRLDRLALEFNNATTNRA